MANSELRFGTITGTLVDYLPVTGIHGDGSTFSSHFLQVKLDTIDIESAQWEWPHFHYAYMVLADLLSDAPTLGDHISADGELGLTHFALDGNGMITAAKIKMWFQQLSLFVDNWSEVNLVDEQRRAFDALTQRFADSPWQIDEWLNLQTELLSDSKALDQLQALLVHTIHQRDEVYAKSAPVTALMQDASRVDVTRGGWFEPLSLGHFVSADHELRLYDPEDLTKLHDSLLAQSAELNRRRGPEIIA